MNMLKKTILMLAATTLLLPALAWAKPEITISIIAEKDIVVEENGQKVTKRVLAEEVTPGEIIIYTIAYTNSGDEAASNVAIVDPIPEGMAYIADSATKNGEVTFSLDGGKSYEAPSSLTYEVTLADGTREQRVATPNQYTQIRWIIPVIAAGDSGTLSFQVRTNNL